MTDKLLGVIAINLTILTGLMVFQSIIPTATAQSGVQKIAICSPSGLDCAFLKLSNSFFLIQKQKILYTAL